MSLNLTNLEDARPFMLAEIRADIAAGKLFLSPRLSPTGLKEYPNLLIQAVQSQNDTWLSTQLRTPGYFNSTEQRKLKTGLISAKIPSNAPDMLAEGEFNRFYIRGVCLLAIEKGTQLVEVYRAKQVSNPRPESQRLIGTEVNSNALLTDLRANIGLDTIFRLPPGPNSGLSVRMP
jgi:hypothetical protein